VTAPTVPLSDLPALARAQLRALRQDVTARARRSTGTAQAHWADLGDRIGAILDPRG
jgi:hypothetical protein